ncbi:MAG: hypothetical protein Q7T50_02975, partial [Candidatus Magasanikbacteria bacterium]|nr:hypothetical protein [Candidatus Magasanikbacteria bacterium]
IETLGYPAGVVLPKVYEAANGYQIIKYVEKSTGINEMELSHILVCFAGATGCESTRDQLGASLVIDEILSKITPENFAELITLVYQDKINSSAGQQILEVMYKKGGDPTDIMTELGLEQLDNDEEMETAIKEVIAKNPTQTAEYKNGKEALIQFFVGQVMAATKGKAIPKKLIPLLKKHLSE